MNKTRISAADKALRYMGRIDFSGEFPLFIYAASSVTVDFTGTSISAVIRNRPMDKRYAIGAIVDGIQYRIELADGYDEQVLPIVTGLENTTHTLTLFKRQAAAHYFELCAIELDEGATVSYHAHDYRLKIEVYGDSVSAGEVTEAVYYEAHSDPENHFGFYDNPYFAYTMSMARKLDAELYNNSQGGLSLFDKTGYFNAPDYVGLETTFDKLSYVPYAGCGYSDWDFTRYTPDLVVIAIGQNDPNPNPDAIKEPAYRRRWKEKYKQIVRTLQGHYGEQVRFIFITTVLMHDSVWDEVLDEVCAELASERITRFRFSRNGAATPGHPRITEHEEMARELTDYVRTIFPALSK